jgi:poly(A) polymerase
MKLGGDWLLAAKPVLDLLQDAGFQAFAVGGCVRNAALGEPVADVDIATDAHPETVTVLAEKAGFRAEPTGIDHGTVTVVTPKGAYEVTTFRRDVETDGRRAVVAYSDNLREDAARRDFTMNAIYVDRDGTVTDPLDGLGDLLARRLRFVGTPGDRIREDYLRILRFFRFYAHYGDPAQGPDPEGLAACAAFSAGIETLSRERVGAEVRKLLSAKDPAPAVASMAHAGVLSRVLPGSDPRALAPLIHLEAGLPPRWQRRLAVLGGDTSGLRLSKAEAREIDVIRSEIGAFATPSTLAYRHGRTLAADTALARAAVLQSPPPMGWQAQIERGATARFPLRAADLMPGLQGPELGARLKALEMAWVKSDFALTRQELLDPGFPLP